MRSSRPRFESRRIQRRDGLRKRTGASERGRAQDREGRAPRNARPRLAGAFPLLEQDEELGHLTAALAVEELTDDVCPDRSRSIEYDARRGNCGPRDRTMCPSEEVILLESAALREGRRLVLTPATFHPNGHAGRPFSLWTSSPIWLTKGG